MTLSAPKREDDLAALGDPDVYRKFAAAYFEVDVPKSPIAHGQAARRQARAPHLTRVHATSARSATASDTVLVCRPTSMRG
jgi:hypothetical protein